MGINTFDENLLNAHCPKISGIILMGVNDKLSQGTFSIEFVQNRLKRSNFCRFWIFWKFTPNCLITRVNFKSQAQVLCANVLILNNFFLWNLVRIGQDLWILDECDLKFFFIVTLNCSNSMYPRIFLCEEANIKQYAVSKKELCEIGEEAIWEFRFLFCYSNNFRPLTIKHFPCYSVSVNRFSL